MATSNIHIPVLLNEVLSSFSHLANQPESGFKTALDCTLGGAGHTAGILEYYSNCKVLACDIDPNAIENAKPRLGAYEDRLSFINLNFSKLVDASPGIFHKGFEPPWDAILMDLGYSSNQLESDDYGLSFQLDVPLDMRLSRQGTTAWDLLEETTEKELAEIFRVYGEMPAAGKLAHKIKAAILKGEIKNSTQSLAQFTERVLGRSRMRIHPATLVFQSLRIAVNDELRALDHFLEGAILKMKEGGRISIITFHSLEDKIVKRWGIKNKPSLNWITKKPIVASTEEIKANPRSRSAKLRVFEKRSA